jgi:formylglycine-generating enzyme required for sulfatase activity
VGSDLVFTISWDNSWFTTLGSNNWDAVWIFVKRQNCTDNLWKHALLNTSSGAHSVTGGLVQVDAVADGMGVYIRRFAVGAGSVPTATVTLSLQIAANTVDNFQIHGIEMVAVPQGDFALGTGSSANIANCNYAPITITSAIQASGINTAAFNGPCSINDYHSSLPATFPLGWNNFYAMKYEISQDQYAAFLNTLTYTQQTSRMSVNPSSAVGTPIFGATTNRNGLEIQVPGVVSNVPALIGSDLNNNNVWNENADGQNIACNWINWQDLIAYLDWSAMRPMTEFEFEKLCRGTEPYFGFTEYAWGTSSLLGASGAALNNAGTPSETSTSAGLGLCAYSIAGATGPLRCGFAAALTTRQQAGAGFYGNMELSGNVWEQCIGGRSQVNISTFTTANGNGALNTAGFCDIFTWPANGGANTGTALRGGAWNSAAQTLNTGDRSGRGINNPSTSNTRADNVGGRGVRNY